MTTPKVSVLMPCLNPKPEWFRIAARGIANQSYENLDLVIADNGSDGTTVGIIKKLQEENPDNVLSARRPEPKGTAYALDAALGIADPKTIYFSKADADDIFHPDREKNRVEFFEKLPPQIAVLYDNYLQLVYHPRPHVIPIILRPYDYRLLCEQSYIPGNSMYRASVYDKIPMTYVYDGYDGKANKHGEDYAHWLSITDHWDAFWYDQDPALTWTYRFYRESKYNRDKKGVDFARAHIQHMAKERRNLL